jgi:bacillithiol system protein YtxJ
MHTTPLLRSLSTVPELEAAIAQSSTRPVVLFKHSPTCGTSACAHEEVEELLSGPELQADVFVVNVLRHRDVSNAIATTFRVHHESPQVLLIVNGRMTWNASHYSVTARAISYQLRSLTVTTPTA